MLTNATRPNKRGLTLLIYQLGRRYPKGYPLFYARIIEKSCGLLKPTVKKTVRGTVFREER